MSRARSMSRRKRRKRSRSGFPRIPFLRPEALRGGRWAFLLALFLSFIVLAIALFRPGGVLEVYQLSERVQVTEEEISALGEENAELKGEIETLRGDPRTLERIAREELGLVKPGETVYEFIEEEEDGRP